MLEVGRGREGVEAERKTLWDSALKKAQYLARLLLRQKSSFDGSAV
jgi:hypothetical protein